MSMDLARLPSRIAFVGDFPPRQCGIATFTHDLCESMAASFPQSQFLVGAVNDRPEGYTYPPRVRFEFHELGAGFLPPRGGFPEHQRCRDALRAARVRHFRRTRREPSAGAARQGANARGHHAAHRAARAKTMRSGRSCASSHTALRPARGYGPTRASNCCAKCMTCRRKRSTSFRTASRTSRSWTPRFTRAGSASRAAPCCSASG